MRALSQFLPATVIISRYIKEKVIIPPAVYLALIKHVPEYNSRESRSGLMSVDMKHKLEITGVKYIDELDIYLRVIIR